MSRVQWSLLIFVGVVAVVAFSRTEAIAQRLGMSNIIKRRNTGGIA